MSIPEFFLDLKRCCKDTLLRILLNYDITAFHHDFSSNYLRFSFFFSSARCTHPPAMDICDNVLSRALQCVRDARMPVHRDNGNGKANEYPENNSHGRDLRPCEPCIAGQQQHRCKEGRFVRVERIYTGSFYCGYVLTHIPGGMIAEKYGGKHTLGFGVLLTAVFTLITPAAVYIGDSTALIIVRALMGFGEGTTYPAVNVLLAQWTPPEERSRTASFVYAGALIGTIFTTTVSGWILQYSRVGWPLVFYVMGIISIVWFLIWLVTCYNSPREHPYISDQEASYLKERMEEHTHAKPPPVPWRHILTSKPLWAAIIALIGFNWSIITMITDLPKYMSGVLKFSVENNGYLTSLVYFCVWSGGCASSWLADYLTAKRNVSTTKVRKWGSISALTISAVFIVAASYAGCDRALVIGMFVVGMTLLGTGYPSVMINALDLSPNYAGTIMGLTNGLSALTGIASPYVIGLMTTNQTLGEWRSVFWILFALCAFCNLIFLVFGSGDVEHWNDPEFVKSEISEMERKESVKQES